MFKSFHETRDGADDLHSVVRCLIAYDTHSPLDGTAGDDVISRQTSRTDNFPCSLIIFGLYVVTGGTEEDRLFI